MSEIPFKGEIRRDYIRVAVVYVFCEKIRIFVRCNVFVYNWIFVVG